MSENRENPLVSIIIPTYNHAHFLDKALKSVLAQTRVQWEALVIDNHSSDGTENLVRGFGDPRIQFHRIHNNGVIAASRNRGLELATGDWVAFLDSDDCWYPEKLDALLEAANECTTDVVCNNELLVDVTNGEHRELHYGPTSKAMYRDMLMDGNRLSTSATMVRRSFLERYALRFPDAASFVTVEDFGFWLELARCGACFTFVPKVLGEYLVHGTNSSGKVKLHWDNCESLLRHHVFSVQQFCSNRDALWKMVSPWIQVARIRILMGEGRLLDAVTLAASTFATRPSGMLSYAFRKSGKYLRRFWS